MNKQKQPQEQKLEKDLNVDMKTIYKKVNNSCSSQSGH